MTRWVNNDMPHNQPRWDGQPPAEYIGCRGVVFAVVASIVLWAIIAGVVWAIIR